MQESCIMMPFIADVSKSMSARQKLEAQLTENNIVKEVTYCNTIISRISEVLVVYCFNGFSYKNKT